MGPEQSPDEVASPSREDGSERNRVLGEAFKEHYRRLRNHAAALVRHRADPDEVVAEAFRRALASWHTYDPKRPIYQWLAAIVRNTATDFLRQSCRSKEVTGTGAEPAYETGTDAQFWGQAAQDLVKRIGACVSPGLRKHLVNVLEFGVSAAASRRSGITEGAGRNKLKSCGRQYIQKTAKPEWVDFRLCLFDFARAFCPCRLKKLSSAVKNGEQMACFWTIESRVWQSFYDSSSRLPPGPLDPAAHLDVVCRHSHLAASKYLWAYRELKRCSGEWQEHVDTQVAFLIGVLAAFRTMGAELGWGGVTEKHRERLRELLGQDGEDAAIVIRAETIEMSLEYGQLYSLGCGDKCRSVTLIQGDKELHRVPWHGRSSGVFMQGFWPIILSGGDD